MDFLTPCFFLAALFGYATSSDLSFGGNPENLSTLVPSSTEVKLEISTPTTSSPLTANVPMPVNIGKGTEECYDELGCFDTNGPWFTITRPFPAPSKPEVIKTGLHLFTRNHNKSHHVKLWPEIKLDGTDYDPKRTTVFITHGFAADSSAQWMHDMKDAYLENSDANVFLTDWGHGARLINYLQAGSNTRVVGAELARFGKHLLEKGQSPDKMHLIGHSLGAHISGYFAKRMKSWNHTVSRVTACDPAQPGFELEDGVVKLKKGDADVVDVIHTDARPFIPFLGFGMLQPIGDVDFYVNGGAQQPGCYSVEVPENITSIADLALIPVETLSKWVSCSHGRSYEYLTWSFKNKDCLFVGRKMTNVENAFKVGTLGTLRLVDPVVDSVRSCTKENCNIMGLFTPNVPARGSFAVSTNSEPPYCKSEEDKQRSLYNVLSLGTYGLAKKALPTLKKINLFSP